MQKYPTLGGARDREKEGWGEPECSPLHLSSHLGLDQAGSLSEMWAGFDQF